MTSPTPRETEIWRLVAQGRSSRSIAFHLRLSQKTVTNHRERVMLKVGARNVADLTRAAIAHEIVPVPTLATEAQHAAARLSLTLVRDCATVAA